MNTKEIIDEFTQKVNDHLNDKIKITEKDFYVDFLQKILDNNDYDNKKVMNYLNYLEGCVVELLNMNWEGERSADFIMGIKHVKHIKERNKK